MQSPKNIVQKQLLIHLFIIFLFHTGNQAFSQELSKIKWHDPIENSFPVLQGQGWRENLKSPYDRLPAKAESKVRSAVWSGSRNTAGLNIRFESNAEEIIVRYVVEGAHSMLHMPATGVSGVDLYAFSKDGGLEWASGRYKFGDTIEYRFSNLKLDEFYKKHGRLYQLYLPLYNKVKWMQIGVSDSSKIAFLPVRPEKPIVVYGTSIAQGGCASRPGMAWTAILERKLDQPLINLAFSGNGRLEKEVLDLVVELDASLFILDCLPNLTSKVLYPPVEINKRIIESVKQIRDKHPLTPILLTEHCGSTINLLNTSKADIVKEVNLTMQDAFKQLQSDGFKNIYLLPASEIALNIDCTVDGTHPNDLGMQFYADAYEKTIRKILSEPIGSISTTKPCIQYRDKSTYNWLSRHNQILSSNKAHAPKIVFLGNSITHYWGGEPMAPVNRGIDSWNQYFSPKEARNLGFGWDRIENVLWRIYHGELDGYNASDIVLLIGTNNLSVNTDDEIITGINFLIKEIRVRQPTAKILIMSLLPRKNNESRIASLNKKIMSIKRSPNTHYISAEKLFLNKSGQINEALFTSDGVHPNALGYDLLAPLINSSLSKN